MRKTKIICTLGPSVASEAAIEELLLKGMNAARFNFSHGTQESHKKMLDSLLKICTRLKMSVATILDTRGPEIRIKSFKDGKSVLQEGSLFSLIAEEILGDETKVSITYPDLYSEIDVGTKILLDDGLIELSVKEIVGCRIDCIVVSGGVLTDNKSINLPERILNLPYLTEQDISDIKFAVKNDFDFIAASFVRRSSDVLAIRDLLRSYGGSDIRIIAKIENREGVDHIKEIVETADAVMVARGDLGVEIPICEVPIIQKQIIRFCQEFGKPVIIATQMLDSMIRNPRPSRAEVSDVANAVFDGASAIMLSGETASGKYPIESVETMSKIAVTAENSIDYWNRFRAIELSGKKSINYAISHSCCTTAMDLQAQAIITVTQTGKTARLISRFRPQCNIAAITTSEKVRRQLSISWGVFTEFGTEVSSTDELFDIGLNKALEMKLVEKGDLVVITAGVPIGISGSTNLIKAQIV